MTILNAHAQTDDRLTEPTTTPPAPKPSASFVASRLLDQFAGSASGDLVYVARSESSANAIAAALRSLAPHLVVIALGPWDCLPYDRVAPSPACMGRRMAALQAILSESAAPRLIVTSLDALLQRVPPAEAIETGRFSLRKGERFDREAFRMFAERTGYVLDETVDEPGEIALLEDVVDVFPAAGDWPVRILLGDGGVIDDLRRYNAVSQRSEESLDALTIGPASELVTMEDAKKPDEPDPGKQADAAGDPDDVAVSISDADAEPDAARLSMERQMFQLYGELPTVFELLRSATLCMAEEVGPRLEVYLDIIDEAGRAQRDFGKGAEASKNRLYLDGADWRRALKGRTVVDVTLDGYEALPALVGQADDRKQLRAYLAEQTQAGRTIVLAGTDERRGGLVRRVETALKTSSSEVDSWQAVKAALPGSLLRAGFALASGFADPAAGITLLTVADVLGHPVPTQAEAIVSPLLREPELRIGDVVVHEDHGVGVLRALETLTVEGDVRDAVRLDYHGGASLLVPVEEFGRLWRYGSQEEAVSLDRLHGDAWGKRKALVARDIRRAAQHLIALAAARETAKVEPIVPPRRGYLNFVARFPYPETADQVAAIDAVLADLASGKSMNRLICGDVGFGKTEIALRAAAAVALSGRQVVVLAPTTVLTRQHFLTFERRFAGSGVKVALLSRVVGSADAKAVKAGLKSGDIGIVVATQAVMAKDVEFADLALMIVDEEHRFGTRDKQAMRVLAPQLHVLSMTATPIPRTLQAAMVGVQDVSLLLTPPMRRRPVRTHLTSFDPASVRIALLREKRRKGQSFVVVPRIEDIAGLQAQLEQLVPELVLKVAHGKLPAATMDAVMVGFADGEGDVLLSTNIIESGLDVPRANTMFIWRADRFGLAQLHQLRGRVGRGGTQGVVYLLTADGEEIAPDTRARLQTMVSFDRLGSGLAISARDLDLRGGGDLAGDEQAGHMKVIGISLYQQMLSRAVSAARGTVPEDAKAAEIQIGMTGAIPGEYVPEATVRLNLYARLLKLTTDAEIGGFAEELEDRFGDIPAQTDVLLQFTRIRAAAARCGIARIDAGPLAIAIGLGGRRKAADWKRICTATGAQKREDRLIFEQETQADQARMDLITCLVARIAAALG